MLYHHTRGANVKRRSLHDDLQLLQVPLARVASGSMTLGNAQQRITPARIVDGQVIGSAPQSAQLRRPSAGPATRRATLPSVVGPARRLNAVPQAPAGHLLRRRISRMETADVWMTPPVIDHPSQSTFACSMATSPPAS